MSKTQKVVNIQKRLKGSIRNYGMKMRHMEKSFPSCVPSILLMNLACETSFDFYIKEPGSKTVDLPIQEQYMIISLHMTKANKLLTSEKIYLAEAKKMFNELNLAYGKLGFRFINDLKFDHITLNLFLKYLFNKPESCGDISNFKTFFDDELKPLIKARSDISTTKIDLNESMTKYNEFNENDELNKQIKDAKAEVKRLKRIQREKQATKKEELKIETKNRTIESLSKVSSALYSKSMEVGYKYIEKNKLNIDPRIVEEMIRVGL